MTINPALNSLSFNVTDTFEDVQEWWNTHPEYFSDAVKSLDEPSGLKEVLLASQDIYPLPRKWRKVDFTGTTVKSAILKILLFYKHKTYRKMIGDHMFFEGFSEDELPKICLGS